MISYTPDPYTTTWQWTKHIFLFLFVLILSSIGLAVTRVGSAEWVMSVLAFVANWFVLGLAIYESKYKKAQS